MGDDARYMSRALALAAEGLGRTAPNPVVGCVLVKTGEIVGEGWHKAAGHPHAEAEALAAAGANAKGATAYVTLEPCNHHGRTPPCAEALLKAGVAEVVYALPDPNILASGGAAFLEKNGVKVRTGVCEEKARDLNRFWLHAVKTDQPYVIAKFAMSLDGKISARSGDSKWITGIKARQRAHELRRQVDAIVVGAGTVIADDPTLTARDGPVVTGAPLRVVLDSTGRTPPGAMVYDRAGRGALLATTTRTSAARLESYSTLGVETLVLDDDHDGRTALAPLLAALRERGANGVLVEGGAETLGAFFDENLVNEVWAFIAPVIVGAGKSAVAGRGAERIADALKLTDVETEQLGPDFLLRGRVNREAR